MGNRKSNHAEFLNIDIEIGIDNPGEISQFCTIFDGKVIFLQSSPGLVAFELNIELSNIDEALKSITSMLKSLSAEDFAVWSKYKTKRANIGIMSGTNSDQTTFFITNREMSELMHLGFDVSITVYSSS